MNGTAHLSREGGNLLTLVHGFQSRVEKIYLLTSKITRADARPAPGMTAAWLPYVPAAN